MNSFKEGSMFFSWLYKIADEERSSAVKIRKTVSEEVLLKEAYHIGRYSPTNCECPPAPDIIPIWVRNNVQALELYTDRLLEEYVVPPEIEPRLFQNMYQGFRDLVLSHPDEGCSPFCLSSRETLAIARKIFVELAAKHGHAITIDA
jgi:hypothetical protein